MISPTRQQLKVLRFIAGFVEANGGITPSLSDIKRGCGIAHKSRVHYCINALVERGAIRRITGKPGAFELVESVLTPRSPGGDPLYYIAIEDLAKAVISPASGGAETGGMGLMDAYRPEGTRGTTPTLQSCTTATAPVKSPSTGIPS